MLKRYSKIPLVAFSLVFIAISLFVVDTARANQKEVADILDSAEGFFKDLQNKSFTKAWQGLSEKSRNTIVSDIAKSISKEVTIPTEKIAEDMNTCGEICKSYWGGFLRSFDPDIALNQCKWEMGTISGNTAEIIITYKKAERPAILKMFKEQGKWRVGLVETFWTRKP